jgi:hypothetical protein
MIIQHQYESQYFLKCLNKYLYYDIHDLDFWGVECSKPLHPPLD